MGKLWFSLLAAHSCSCCLCVGMMGAPNRAPHSFRMNFHTPLNMVFGHTHLRITEAHQRFSTQVFLFRPTSEIPMSSSSGCLSFPFSRGGADQSDHPAPLRGDPSLRGLVAHAAPRLAQDAPGQGLGAARGRQRGGAGRHG